MRTLVNRSGKRKWRLVGVEIFRDLQLTLFGIGIVEPLGATEEGDYEEFLSSDLLAGSF